MKHCPVCSVHTILLTARWIWKLPYGVALIVPILQMSKVSRSKVSWGAKTVQSVNKRARIWIHGSEAQGSYLESPVWTPLDNSALSPDTEVFWLVCSEKAVNPYSVLPLLLGTWRVTEIPSPPLWKLLQIKINAAGEQKLKPIPSYINLLEYNTSRLLFLPIMPTNQEGKFIMKTEGVSQGTCIGMTSNFHWFKFHSGTHQLVVENF